MNKKTDKCELGPCRNYDCRHNMFWRKLELKFHKETESSLEFNNCMSNVNRPFTLEEISEMWGLSKDRINVIESVAKRKLFVRGSKLRKNLRNYC